MRRSLALAALSASVVACSSGSKPTSTMMNHPPPPPADIPFTAFGSSSAPAGKGGFRFGASSAATQIEDMNTTTDWYKWTDPKRLANDTFIGNAVDGYTMAIDDVKLLTAMHLDSYRFSIEWARGGLLGVLSDFSTRWPDLPLVVTESGIATHVGARRAEIIVRALEQIDKARQGGADVRGYYHSSIYDNFEWASGFVPKFGLYSVDLSTYARTPTEAATVFGEIVEGRKVTSALRSKYGGSGPLTPEAAADGG
jgi:beta-glucosidase/6-phospho-beta-glucosidase/beta-galactosidase